MEREFYCPLDVGFLSSDLSTPESLERFLSYYGIGIAFLGDKNQNNKKPEKPPSPTPTKPPRRPPEVNYIIRKTPAHKVPRDGKK